MKLLKKGLSKSKSIKCFYKLLNLPIGEKYLLFQAGVLLCTSRLALSLLPFQTWKSWLLSTSNTPIKNTHSYSMETIVWAIQVANRFIPNSTCLVQAMALHALLKKYHYPSEIQIGVKKNTEGNFEAHAWVTSLDQIRIGITQDLHEYKQLPLNINRLHPNTLKNM